jgi:SAM-dependent methyltransferase
MYRRLLRWLGRRRDKGWRARSDPVRGRRHALREEVDYWRRWLATRGGKWPEEYAHRFDPSAEIADPALREVIANVPTDEVSILDVGSGPASTVGCTFPGKTIALVAVDPLADIYARLLEEAGVSPPVRVSRAEGERLLDRFGRARFDIAYARNSLDHAVDPAPVIDNMLAVVRPGGHVVLRHVRDEAVRQGYVQLHQWNFTVRDDRLVVWRPGHETDLTAALAGRADVRCHVEPNAEDAEDIVCVMEKLAAA